MNYYEHHLRDYDADTAHLSWVEDMAYSRLIRLYYRTEKPIPAEMRDACRLVRAVSKHERQAVGDVLREFFTLEADGWHQSRCDGEIERFQAGEPEREVKKANESNRLKRHRDERAELFKVITEAGQHLPWNVGMNELRDAVKRVPATATETLVPPLPATAPATLATATQTPDTRHQTPVLKEDRARAIPAGEATKAMREAGLADANPSHPKLIALLQAGITVDELRSAAKAAAEGGKGFAYALGKAEGRRRDAVVTPLPGDRIGPVPRAAEPEWRREQRERMEQAAPYAVSRPTAARTTPETFTDDEATDVLPLARPTT